MLRVVLDSNVLIAALLSGRGAPAALLKLLVDGAFELIVCPTLLDELSEVLRRPKFRPYVTEEECRAYCARVKRLAVTAPDPPAIDRVSPDPGDDYLIALAREAGAHVLVSGDTHLTRLTIVPPVLTPRAFLSALER